MPDPIVVDASFALKWVLTEPGSTEALVKLAEWQRDGVQPTAPSWIACEMANVLYGAALTGTFTLDDAEALFDVAVEQIAIEPEAPGDARRSMRIASEAGQRQTYDAQYAALAERLGCELWTADEKFGDAARGVLPGVRLLRELMPPGR